MHAPSERQSERTFIEKLTLSKHIDAEKGHFCLFAGTPWW